MHTLLKYSYLVRLFFIFHFFAHIFSGTGTLAGPFLYTAFYSNLHILAVYIWVTLRLSQAIDAHSGYGMY